MRSRAPRALLLAAAAAVGLTLAAAPAGASAATCATQKLVVWLPKGLGNGAAGSVFYKLRITNAGSAACTLAGFPRVRAVDLKGRPIGKPATKEAGQKAATVKLAAGGSAGFQLRIVSPGNFSPADCHPATAAGLRVSPPGGGGSKLVPLPFETCAKPTQPVLSVGPIRKG